MNILTFNGVEFQPVKQQNQIWLTSNELARALGYAETDSVTKLYNRHIDEFKPSMTQVIDISETVKLTAPKNQQNLVKKVRIFNLRGCHLIAMFAKTKIAKEFRQWVLDILDKEVGQPVQVSPKLSDNQAYQIQKAVKAKCLHNRLHYQTLYRRLYDEFGIKSYKDILACDFERALAFIESFVFVPNLGLIHNILVDQAHQTKKAKGELNDMIGVVKQLIDHIDELQQRLDISVRNIVALRTRFIV